MTVIAWDGKTLAADKLMDHNGMRRTTRKVHRSGGCLVGLAGSSTLCREFLDWFGKGALLESFPSALRAEDASMCALVITPARQILLYLDGPMPIEICDPTYAIGSGGDCAMAALHMGRSAVAAVQIAIDLTVYCGGPIDTLTLEGV